MNTPTGSAPDLSLDQIVELERRAAEREAASGSGDGPGDRPPPTTVDGDADVDDPIILPWWQHPMNIVTMLVTAALLAGMIGWMIGDSGAQIEHDDVDTGFLQDMREHHEQAVSMSFLYRALPDTDNSLAVIAGSIIQGQQLEIGRMIQLLRDFGEEEAGDGETTMQWMGMSAAAGQMPGMASDDELAQLADSSGTEADELFVQLMTAHHLGGIEMAEYAAEHAGSAEVRAMAASMAHAQRAEIVEMTARLQA